MVSNLYGKNSTLNACSNSSSFECIFNEAMVLANDDGLVVGCTEKPAQTVRR